MNGVKRFFSAVGLIAASLWGGVVSIFLPGGQSRRACSPARPTPSAAPRVRMIEPGKRYEVVCTAAQAEAVGLLLTHCRCRVLETLGTETGLFVAACSAAKLDEQQMLSLVGRLRHFKRLNAYRAKHAENNTQGSPESGKAGGCSAEHGCSHLGGRTGQTATFQTS